jgi:hypothetical protein
VAIAIAFLFLVLSCKTKIGSSSHGVTVKVSASDTITSGFRPLPPHKILDSIPFAALAIENGSVEETGIRYYDSKLFRRNDIPFSVLNVYGEATGGATYNPFGESYIIRNGAIAKVPVPGEVFRIDQLAGGYLLYVDEFSRMGNNFRIYELTFMNDSFRAVPAKAHGNYLFDLILNKKEAPENFPAKVDRRKRFTEKEVQGLRLDTTQVGLNDFFFLTDDLFLSKQPDSLNFRIYFTHKFGDEFTKWLRIERENKIHDQLLAQTGGDSNSYMTLSEFVDDSTFVRTSTLTETAVDEETRKGYDTDSIVTRYKYNINFDFTETAKDSFRIYKEYELKADKYRESKRVLSGPLFLVNNQECFWRYDIFYDFPDEVTQQSYARLIRKLVSSQKGEVLLENNVDFIKKADIGFPGADEAFPDVNFDGFADYTVYDESQSGSSGAFENVYLYDPQKKRFVYSEMLSGPNFEVDAASRHVSTTSKAGYGYYNIRMIYFGSGGKIRFSKEYRSSYDKVKRMWILSYTKLSGKKVLDRKTISVSPDNDEDVYNLLLGLGGE